MKLADILQNLDKSNPDYSCHYTVAEELEIWSFFSYQENTKLACYPVHTWLCTDTHVGVYAYFLEDEFVALSTQEARKCDVEFEWASISAYNAVERYIRSLDEAENQKAHKLIAPNEEYDLLQPVNYSSQLLTNQLYCVETKQKVTVIEKWTSYKNEDMDKWHQVRVRYEDGTERVGSLNEDYLLPLNVNKEFLEECLND